MRCPSISELPSPPPGRCGWPWTEESARVPEGVTGPRITVVTPSFNQGRFIEEAIRSILLQGYPDLEYIVLDGGSTDNTVEIVEKYSPWIHFWTSEPDNGQSAAINRGLKMGSGLYATWINSDDMLCKSAFTSHVMNHPTAEDVVYVGDCVSIDERGAVLFTHRGRVQCLEDLVRVPSVWHSGGSIDQPAVLFPLVLALRAGGLNERNHYTMDYELWGQFFLAGAKVRYTGIPFGFFRWHPQQKTQDNLKQTESRLDAAEALVARASFLSAETKQDILADLKDYRYKYPEQQWKSSGRLARIGLPRSIVKKVRHFRSAVDKTITNFITSAGSR
jgi:glycosyltransferase involved in cell wall biosynthesis